MINLSEYLRQLELVNQERLGELGLTVVGCGVVGSLTALACVKLGVGNLVLYDSDKVEIHNLSNQLYTKEDLDHNKAIACYEHLKHHTTDNQRILTYNQAFKEQAITTEIVLASVDTIEARETILKQAIVSEVCKLYIDSRMLANNLTVFTVDLTNNQDIEAFYKDFIEDITNQEARCSARSVCYNGFMCASLVTSLIAKYANKQPLPLQLGYCFTNNYHLLGALNK